MFQQYMRMPWKSAQKARDWFSKNRARTLPARRAAMQKFHKLHPNYRIERAKKKTLEKAEMNFPFAKLARFAKKERKLLTADKARYFRRFYAKHAEVKRAARRERHRLGKDRPEYRARLRASRKKQNQREQVRIANRIRKRVREVVKGKIKGSGQTCAELGIDAHAIARHLGARPGPGWDIDHIIPLAKYDLTRPEHVRKAFAPENHQWLPSVENQQIKRANMPRDPPRHLLP